MGTLWTQLFDFFLYLSDAEDAHAAWKYRQFLFIFIFFTFEFLGIGLSVSATHHTVYRSFLKLCKSFVYGLGM